MLSSQEFDLQKIEKKMKETLKIGKVLIEEANTKENGWTQFIKEDNLQCFEKIDTITQIKITKSMGIIKAPPLRVIELYLTDEKAMLQARSNVDSIEKIAELKNKEQTYIIRYWKTHKPQLLIAKRDFLLCGTYLQNQDGSYYTVCTSIRPDLLTKKDYVRGEVILCFVIFTHIIPKDNNTKSLITQVQLNDSKGQLPLFILNKAQKEAATVIKLFNQYLEKLNPEPKL